MPVNRIAHLPLAFCICLFTHAIGKAQFPTIELHAVDPVAMQAGRTYPLRILGNRTDELSQVRFSHPGITADPVLHANALGNSIATGAFNVSVSDSVPAGLYSVRACGRFGVSNPRPILVSNRTISTLDGQAHADPGLAQTLAPGQIYIADYVAQKRLFWRIELAEGQRLRCVAYARQFDSAAIPVLVLHDESQEREISRSRAVGDWPAEIDFIAPRQGAYLIETHDFLYLGGNRHKVLVEALVSDPAERSTLQLDDVCRPSLVRPSVLSRFDNVARIQSLREQPPRPSVEYQQAILTPPFSVRGDFCDDSVVQFSAKKNETLWIEVVSAQADQLTDPLLLVARREQNGEPKILAQKDDDTSIGLPDMRLRARDPSLKWTAPDDGTYEIRLLNQSAGSASDDATGWVLNVRPPAPAFSLLAFNDFPNVNRAAARPMGSHLLAGGTHAIRVMVVRQDGFNGPVQVTASGLPAGVDCPPIVIPVGATEGTLILSASRDAPFACCPISVWGEATVDERPRRSKAVFGAIAHAPTPTRNAISSRLASDLLICVNDKDVAPYVVQLGDGSIPEVAAGKKTKIPITVHRQDQGKVALHLRAQNLPPKIGLGEVKIAADKDSAEAELNVPAGFPAGEYTLWMQSESKLKWSANPQAVSRAEGYLKQLQERQQQLATADAQSSASEQKKIQAAIDAQAKIIKDAKAQSAAKDVTVWVPSTLLRFRVVAAD